MSLKEYQDDIRNFLIIIMIVIIIIIILLKKRHSLTGVKLIALYKELDKTRIYIHFNKQILKYSILHVAFDFFFLTPENSTIQKLPIIIIITPKSKTLNRVGDALALTGAAHLRSVGNESKQSREAETVCLIVSDSGCVST